MIVGHPAATAQAYALPPEYLRMATALAVAAVENATAPGALSNHEKLRLFAQIERDVLVLIADLRRMAQRGILP